MPRHYSAKYQRQNPQTRSINVSSESLIWMLHQIFQQRIFFVRESIFFPAALRFAAACQFSNRQFAERLAD